MHIIEQEFSREKILREGEAYKIDVINRASGEAARFEKMLVEYKKRIPRCTPKM